jgi:G3E family GTPase
LENVEGIKVGVIVNDVAAINIDSKLIAQREYKPQNSINNNNNDNDNTNITVGDSSVSVSINNSGGGVVQLQNGCACCSLADELWTSIETILDSRMISSSSSSDADDSDTTTTTTTFKSSLDCIVVELSGVADPMAIQNNWRDAIQTQSNLKVTNAVELGQVITVIDACTFGTDYMTWDIVRDRSNWLKDDDTKAHVANRQVVELLAEQVEAATVLVLNKQDMADPDQVLISTSMAASLNPQAKMITTSWGKVLPSQILQWNQPPAATTTMERTVLVKEDPSPNTAPHPQQVVHNHDTSHSHNHDHHPAARVDMEMEVEAVVSCTDPDCTDASHPGHSHSHDHHQEETPQAFEAAAAATATVCSDPGCTDDHHSHSSHSHSHDNAIDTSLATAVLCNDPDCTEGHDDDGGGHSHSHSHAAKRTATTNLGITNFVYKATRPFSVERMRRVLLQWPVPIKTELDLGLMTNAVHEGYDREEEEKDTVDDEKKETKKNPFVGVLRSKGFCWFSPTAWDGLLDDSWRHDTAMYWSHAGKHIGIQTAGPFWDAVSESQRTLFFRGRESEYNRMMQEDFVTVEFGDRRQELVFIGVVGMDPDAITKALDDCLLTDDEEMIVYREQVALRLVLEE